ncbi:hypothetical protein WME79_14650 [Sorangium sp. So ce726]|uniref:hypothetical protein n=1 Tax=Sorangium sp. So ce726 TaxID=3133319 RepID=UPI003F61CF85
MPRERTEFAFLWCFAGLAVVGLIGCAPTRPPAAVLRDSPGISTEERLPFHARPGEFFCRLHHGEREEPRLPCQITDPGDGGRRLASFGEPRRIEGALTPIDHRSFRFDGAFAPEPGAAAEAVTATFEAVDYHLYRGAIRAAGSETWVTLEYLPTPQDLAGQGAAARPGGRPGNPGQR